MLASVTMIVEPGRKHPDINNPLVKLVVILPNIDELDEQVTRGMVDTLIPFQRIHRIPVALVTSVSGLPQVIHGLLSAKTVTQMDIYPFSMDTSLQVHQFYVVLVGLL